MTVSNMEIPLQRAATVAPSEEVTPDAVEPAGGPALWQIGSGVGFGSAPEALRDIEPRSVKEET